MKVKQSVMIVTGIIALLVIGGLAWWLGSPLFINRTVEESFDGGEGESAELVVTDMPASEAEATATMLDKEMNEPMPAATTGTTEDAGAASEPVAVLTGQFQGADDFHQSSGVATFYQLPDGGYVLRLDPFEVINGPDLHVVLSSTPNPANSDQLMQGFIDLGSLKGNIGSQNYALPEGIDISLIHSVVIYCQPFHVIFASASLN